MDPDVQLFYRDTGRLYYPVKKYIAERLLQGQLPLWDPWTECGTSLLGQMSPGLLHPWTLLYALPFDLAFKLNHLLPLLLAGAGTYFLSRRLGASRTASTAAGFIFGGCGYLISQAASNLIYVAGPAGVPLALERFIAALDKPSPKKLITAAALLALCAYAGEPQSMLLCGLIGASFAVARSLSRKEGFKRAIALTAAWGALAAALSAPVTLPAAERLMRGDRAAGLSRYEQTHFALSPRRLPGLFLQRGFNNLPGSWGTVQQSATPQTNTFEEYFESIPFALSIYIGSCAVLFACFGAFAGRRGRFFLIGAGIIALAATGESLGLHPIFRAIIPGYSLFRYSEKLIVFASLLLAVAAALGLDKAFSTRLKPFALTAAAGSVAMAAASFLTPRDWLVSQGATGSVQAAETFIAAVQPALRQEAAALAVLALIAFAARSFPRLPAQAFAAAACGATLLIANSALLVTLPVKLFHEEPPFLKKLVDDAGPSAGNWRLYVRPDREIAMPGMDARLASLEISRLPLRPHFDSLFHVEGVYPYFSNDDANYGALLTSDSSRSAFELFTVAFFVVMPGTITPKEAKALGFVEADYEMWIQLLPRAPRALLLDQAILEPSMDAIGQHLQSYDATRVGLFLQKDAAAVSTVTSAKDRGKAFIQRPSPERISVIADAPTESILEVGEHYDPGWRIQVDGRPAPGLALDGTIEATVVPAGRHQVELHFWPVGFTPGLLIAGAALAVTLAAARRSKP